MTPLDDRLSQAVADLRDDVDNLEAPPFAPKRSTAPVMLVLLLIVGIGIATFVSRSGTGQTGGVSVATQPDQSDADATQVLQGDRLSGTDQASDDQVETTDSPEPERGPIQSIRGGQLANADAGEFLMPLPAGAAWSEDESRLLMYGTGDADPGHFVVDTATGALVGPARLPFTPADIEQVYWHPTDPDVLVYTRLADVMVYNLVTGQLRVLRSFDQCDRVDSGVLPVPPSRDGTLSLLCHSETGIELLVYNLLIDQARQAPTSGDTAAMPSPSGQTLVRWNADGSASALDADLVETGVVFELENNPFVFLTDGNGREWLASTLFDGPVIGTVVVFPLDGADPAVVVIGPERGDAYPPSGTSISAAGAVVAVSIPGADDGSLVGRIVSVDLGSEQVGVSFADAGASAGARNSFAHNSTGVHGYWSTPFLSVSPSGNFVVYSTDSGGDRVNTFIAALTDPAG